jgi:hypothetical protein
VDFHKPLSGDEYEHVPAGRIADEKHADDLMAANGILPVGSVF